MLSDFYIPGLSNDMQIPVQKNHLGCPILYTSVDPAVISSIIFYWHKSSLLNQKTIKFDKIENY